MYEHPRTWKWIRDCTLLMYVPLVYRLLRRRDFCREINSTGAARYKKTRWDRREHRGRMYRRNLKDKRRFALHFPRPLINNPYFIRLGSCFLLWHLSIPHRHRLLRLFLSFLGHLPVLSFAFPPEPSRIFTGRRTSDLFPVGGRVISPVCLTNYSSPPPRLRK